MEGIQGKMTVTSGKKYVDCKEEQYALDIGVTGKEVPNFLSVLDETNEFGSDGAVWLPPLPEYCEKDPLQTDEGPESGVRLPEFGSYSSDDRSSNGSLWDDDDVSVADETGPNWSELDGCGRVRRVLVQWVGKPIALLALLYLFICSLDFLSSAFRILGGKTAGGVFNNSELLGNPVAGLMVGILATVLVQSSSTSTSIMVTMVASGIMDVKTAIPMIMGANIGTSVTNTFVSMAQSGDRREFRRAFAGATVHDMFNWLTVIVLLPLEVITGYLFRLTKAIVDSCQLESYKGGKQELLKALTKPLTSAVVKVDKKVISKIAEGHEEYRDRSLIKKYCEFEEQTVLMNVTRLTNVSLATNGSEEFVLMNVTEEMNVTEKIPLEKCFSLFSHLELDDTVAGSILLVMSLLILCTCLVLMVKLLHSLLQGSIAKVIKKTLNSDFPGCFSWLTGYVAILVGAIMTLLVQSSSVFTSALTPLVGVGMLKVERMFPLTLGSNIGTTGTGLLAAMAASGDKLPFALQIALCHLFFNISGILIFYPIPKLRKIPIKCAKFLGTVTSEYRWFAIAYLIVMFFLLPAGIFAVSLTGTIPTICVAVTVAVIIVIVIIINLLQKHRSESLPKFLRTWEFLPKYLRSLQPIDSAIMKVVSVVTKCCPCCKNCQQKKKPKTSMRAAIKSAGLSNIVIVRDPLKKCSPAPSACSSTALLSSSRI